MIEYKLSDISVIENGGTPSTEITDYWNGNIPWITPNDLSNIKSKWIELGERSISKKGLKNSNAKLIPKFSILVSTRAPIGYIVMNKVDASTNQGMKAVIPNTEIVDPEYLYYSLCKKVKLMNMRAGGTTFKEISTTVFKRIPVQLPSLKIQKSISYRINSYDNKIDINYKLIHKLEEYSRLIFHKWFIDFNFPDENGNPHLVSGGLMKEVDGKNLPKDWTYSLIKNLVLDTISGEWGVDDKDDINNKEVLCIRGADLPNWRVGKTNTTPLRYVSFDRSKQKGLIHGDIVIEISGGSPIQSTGRSVIILNSALNNVDKPVLCSNFSKIIRPKTSEYGLFLGQYLNHLYNRGVFFHYESKTTGIKNLLLSSVLNRLKVNLPPIEIITKFNEIIEPIYDKINHLGNENQLLEETRDLLIKKLVK